MDEKILGIKNILNKQRVNGRLSHAYLFMGPKGAGKKALVMEFAVAVLGILPGDSNPASFSPAGTMASIEAGGSESLLRHPDFAVFDCAKDASSESVRGFIGRIALKPFVAQKKFALVANIENLNAQGANALLKTLEEPPTSTVIALTADTRKVLPTIVSRCQTFSLNRKLSANGNANYSQNVQELSLMNFAGKTLATKLLAVNRFVEMEEAELKQGIEDFIYQAADNLLSAPEKYTQLAAGLKAYEDLFTNKNRKLILQGLLLKI